MANELLKVGQLARRTGLSVRTLHHWEAVGLLVPGRRTASGHRLYGPEEVLRLQQVLALKQLGLSLDEIRDCLDRRRLSPRRVIEMRLERLDRDIEAARALRRRLASLASRLDGPEPVSLQDLLEAIEEMTMIEKHFTKEQQEKLTARREEVGEERIREAEAEWPELIAAVRAEMEKGTDPAAPAVQVLAARWRSLVAEFSGGDRGIEQSVAKMYRAQPDTAARFGLDAAIFEYVGRAATARQGED